jgi:hypothetical protein
MESYVMGMASMVSKYMVTPWLKVRNAVLNTAKMFIPTHIREVIHVNPVTNKVTEVHSGSYWMYNSHLVAKLNSKEAESGYYYIRLWDGLMHTSKEYFLSAKNLQDALGLKCITTWWTLHDYGIQVLLSGWFTYHTIQTRIFSIYDSEGNDHTHNVHAYHSSLEIKGNITAHALTLLLKHQGHMDANKDYVVKKVVDYDLVERTVGDDDCLATGA